jgi:hypothetical protein
MDQGNKEQLKWNLTFGLQLRINKPALFINIRDPQNYPSC